MEIKPPQSQKQTFLPAKVPLSETRPEIEAPTFIQVEEGEEKKFLSPLKPPLIYSFVARMLPVAEETATEKAVTAPLFFPWLLAGGILFLSSPISPDEKEESFRRSRAAQLVYDEGISLYEALQRVELNAWGKLVHKAASFFTDPNAVQASGNPNPPTPNEAALLQAELDYLEEVRDWFVLLHGSEYMQRLARNSSDGTNIRETLFFVITTLERVLNKKNPNPQAVVAILRDTREYLVQEGICTHAQRAHVAPFPSWPHLERISEDTHKEEEEKKKTAMVKKYALQWRLNTEQRTILQTALQNKTADQAGRILEGLQVSADNILNIQIFLNNCGILKNRTPSRISDETLANLVAVADRDLQHKTFTKMELLAFLAALDPLKIDIEAIHLKPLPLRGKAIPYPEEAVGNMREKKRVSFLIRDLEEEEGSVEKLLTDSRLAEEVIAHRQSEVPRKSFVLILFGTAPQPYFDNFCRRFFKETANGSILLFSYNRVTIYTREVDDSDKTVSMNYVSYSPDGKEISGSNRHEKLLPSLILIQDHFSRKPEKRRRERQKPASISYTILLQQHTIERQFNDQQKKGLEIFFRDARTVGLSPQEIRQLLQNFDWYYSIGPGFFEVYAKTREKLKPAERKEIVQNLISRREFTRNISAAIKLLKKL